MKHYVYLDKEKAISGVSLVYGVSDTKVENYIEYFEGRAVEFYGENLPHYITYIEDEDIIREATAEELVSRGDMILSEGEVIINGVIIQYDIYCQKIVDNEIVFKTRQDYIDEGFITLETERDIARSERKIQFEALDLYDKAVLRNDIEESVEMRQDRDEFRTAWLSIPEIYINISISIEELYPIMPDAIIYFK